MRILIVTATGAEVAPVVAQLGPPSVRTPGVSAFSRSGHDVDVLTTGVGMVATAVRCAEVLTTGRYDLALNAGVCGSFVPRFAPGVTVNVTSDRIAELGAEDDEHFLTVHDLNLLGENEFPFHGGCLVNPGHPINPALARLPEAGGITVNTVHGRDASIARARALFQPDVESMEGAAFMYACLVSGLPFAQVRAVSNMVERRNRGAWKLEEAVAGLGVTMLDILDNA